MQPTKNNPAVQERGNDFNNESIIKFNETIITQSLVKTTDTVVFYEGSPTGILPTHQRKAKLDENGYPEVCGRPDHKGRYKVKVSKDLSVHLVVDTEFTGGSLRSDSPETRYHISSQVKLWGQEKGVLFWHPQISDIANTAREKVGLTQCPTLATEYDGFDYLELMGYYFNVRPITDADRKTDLAVLTMVNWFHFGVAELNLMFRGSLLQEVVTAQRDGRITQQRRLIASDKAGAYGGTLHTSFVVNLNGTDYRLALRFMDTAGLHGAVSYATMAKNVGHTLAYKDTLEKKDKEQMERVVLEKAKVFEDYALGDLDIDLIMTKYAQGIEGLYDTLGLKTYYREPKLTIGTTTSHLFEAALTRFFLPQTQTDNWLTGLDQIMKHIIPHSPSEVLGGHRDSRVLLQKVQGGRCGARDGRVSVVRGDKYTYYTDNDYIGCYGEGMRNQLYPIGKPEILARDPSKNNRPLSLLEWLRFYDCKLDSHYRLTDWGELMNGLWQARITCLKTPFFNDIIESWLTPSGATDVTSLRKLITSSETDCERDETKPFSLDYGYLELITDSIHNGVIQHDLLQLIHQECTVKQWLEFIKNTEVIASEVYPKSQQVASIEELTSRINEWTGESTIHRYHNRKKNKTHIITNECECHAWVAFPLGKGLIDDLLVERTRAKIRHGKKSSQQTLFKLFINTLYGVISSPHFKVSKALVGNNITARARVGAYCMERVLKCIQIITDGGIHPQVIKDISSYNPEIESKALWKLMSDKFHTLDIFTAVTTELKVDKETLNVSEVPRQGMFSIAPKRVTKQATFHGSANYYIRAEDIVWDEEGTVTKDVCKARGYEGKQHQAWVLVEGELKRVDCYDSTPPFEAFMRAMTNNPHRVPRGLAATKCNILKVKQYQKEHVKWDKIGLLPGDTIHQFVLVRELSLAQFRFKSLEQVKGWTKQCTSLINKYGQSLEIFFINDDSTLDYQRMIDWVYDAIERGVIKPLDELDPHNHIHRKNPYHPAYHCLQALKEQYAKRDVELDLNRTNYYEWRKEGVNPPVVLYQEQDSTVIPFTRRKGGISKPPETSDARVRKQAHDGREVVTRKRGSIKRAPAAQPPLPVEESQPSIVPTRKRGSIRRQS